MTVPSIDDRLAPSEQVVIRELSGESVLLDLKSGVYFGLNAVGTRIWNLIAHGESLRGVTATLHAEFSAPVAVVEKELLRFAEDLCEHGLCGIEPR
jgi:hypothetical protein